MNTIKTIFLSLIIITNISGIRFSQRQLIKNNYDLTLNNFQIRDLPGAPRFIDVFNRQKTERERALSLYRLMAQVSESISIGARKEQIYPLLAEIKEFLIDHQNEISTLTRVQIEVQIENLENMRWSTT